MSIPAFRDIQTPGELRQMFRELRAAVACGALVQVVPDPDPFATRIRIEHIDPEGPWPDDCITMRFRWNGDATTYLLECETYHGAGGSWGPEDSENR